MYVRRGEGGVRHLPAVPQDQGPHLPLPAQSEEPLQEDRQEVHREEEVHRTGEETLQSSAGGQDGGSDQVFGLQRVEAAKVQCYHRDKFPSANSLLK